MVARALIDNHGLLIDIGGLVAVTRLIVARLVAVSPVGVAIIVVVGPGIGRPVGCDGSRAEKTNTNGACDGNVTVATAPAPSTIVAVSGAGLVEAACVNAGAGLAGRRRQDESSGRDRAGGQSHDGGFPERRHCHISCDSRA